MNRQEWCMKNWDGVEKKGVTPKSRSRKVGHVLTMKPRRCQAMNREIIFELIGNRWDKPEFLEAPKEDKIGKDK